mmetsp:Transcript_104420/g.294352  ORF Transcript_104420/g.294352 Transcript_104420/m.294352 type:complete len:210 (-) Transcript_104420:157-786(-)
MGGAARSQRRCLSASWRWCAPGASRPRSSSHSPPRRPPHRSDIRWPRLPKALRTAAAAPRSNSASAPLWQPLALAALPRQPRQPTWSGKGIIPIPTTWGASASSSRTSPPSSGSTAGTDPTVASASEARRRTIRGGASRPRSRRRARTRWPWTCGRSAARATLLCSTRMTSSRFQTARGGRSAPRMAVPCRSLTKNGRRASTASSRPTH